MAEAAASELEKTTSASGADARWRLGKDTTTWRQLAVSADKCTQLQP